MITYPQVLQDAQKLPPLMQFQLAETLLHDLRGVLATRLHAEERAELSPLFGLSRAELQTLAEAVVAPEHQARLRELLENNQGAPLPREDAAALDALLDEVDHVALLKARALYTLAMFGLAEKAA